MTLEEVHQNRREREREYRERAAYVRGMARALTDLIDHVHQFKAGNDPAREIQKIIMADLRGKHQRTLEEAENLIKRADHVSTLIPATEPEFVMKNTEDTVVWISSQPMEDTGVVDGGC